MSVDVSGAINAYNQVARQAKASGMEARDGPDQGSFADMVKGATESMVDTLKQSEQLTVEAAAGNADMQEVIMSVANAELTLQMVVSVRDKVIQAYQDILRMPI